MVQLGENWETQELVQRINEIINSKDLQELEILIEELLTRHQKLKNRINEEMIKRCSECGQII